MTATMKNTNNSRAPLYTCHGRAVGLLHDWQGGHAMTVSGYGKRVQLSPIRPQASLTLGGCCGLIFSVPASSPHYSKCLCNKCQSAISTVANISHGGGLGHGPSGCGQIRPQPSLRRGRWCGLTFSTLFQYFVNAINVSPHPPLEAYVHNLRTGPATRLMRGI